MQDWHSSQIARARFDAMRRFMPSRWNETAVLEYNEILAALQAAEPEKDFSGFIVPQNEPAPKVTGRDRRGRVLYSSGRYCDAGRMQRRIEGIAAYLAAVDDSRLLASDEPEPPSGSSHLESSRSGYVRSAALAIGQFLWSLVKGIVPEIVKSWLKGKGMIV